MDEEEKQNIWTFYCLYWAIILDSPPAVLESERQSPVSYREEVLEQNGLILESNINAIFVFWPISGQYLIPISNRDSLTSFLRETLQSQQHILVVLRQL